MRYVCCILLALLSSSSFLFSQGQFLADGESGFGIGADYAANSSASGLNGSVGYSIMGRFDIQLSAGQIWVSQQINGYDVTAFQFSPTVNAYIFKEDAATTPITLGVSASYQYAKYSSTGLDLNGETEKQHSFIFGAAAFRSIDMTPDSYAQIFLGAAYSAATADITTSNQTFSPTENKPVFSAGCAFVFKNPPSEQFVIRPELDVDKDYTSIGIGVMLIL